jgi:hypothetical protein
MEQATTGHSSQIAPHRAIDERPPQTLVSQERKKLMHTNLATIKPLQNTRSQQTARNTNTLIFSPGH